MNTKEVCGKLAVTPKMLRVYEAQKLIRAKRSENGYRDYSLDDVLQIQIVVLLRDLGFSLKEIKKVLGLNKSQKDYLTHFYIQLKAVETKINELNAIRDKIGTVINEVLAGTDIQDELLQRHHTPPECQNTIYDTMMSRWNFDLMAVDYVSRYLKEDVGYLSSIQKAAEQLKEMTPGKNVLDVGGGTCNLWLEFPEDTKLSVIEKSLQMIFAAKESVPWADYILEDILFPDKKRIGKFDIVVSTFTLHHISYEQQEKAIRNMFDFCSKDGTVLIVDRSFRSLAEKEKKVSELIEAGNLEFLEIIQSEYYLLSDQIENYIRYLGYQAKTLFFEENIWGFLVDKKKV